MPTHDELAPFLREFNKLTEAEQDAFIDAMKQMVTDLRTRRSFRPRLRVKGVQGHPGVYEMTWASDGRSHVSLRGGATSRGATHRLAPHWRARDPQEPVVRELVK